MTGCVTARWDVWCSQKCTDSETGAVWSSATQKDSRPVVASHVRSHVLGKLQLGQSSVSHKAASSAGVLAVTKSGSCQGMACPVVLRSDSQRPGPRIWSNSSVQPRSYTRKQLGDRRHSKLRTEHCTSPVRSVVPSHQGCSPVGAHPGGQLM